MYSTTVSLNNTVHQPAPNYMSESVAYIRNGRIIKVLNNVESNSEKPAKCFTLFKHCLSKHNHAPSSVIVPLKMRNEQGEWLRESVVTVLQLFQKKVAELNKQKLLTTKELSSQLDQLSDQLNQQSAPVLNETEISSFYQQLKKLADTLPKTSDIQELAELLAVHAKLQSLAGARESLKQQLYQQLIQLEQPGASSKFQAQLRLSVGASLLGLDLLEGSITIKAMFEVLTEDDTGIFEIRSAGLKLSMAGGDKSIVEGEAAVQAGYGTIYSDESLLAFVDRQVDSIMGALFTAATSKSIGHLMDWKRNQTYVELQQQALSSQHRLNNLLLKQGLPAQVVPALGKIKKMPLKMKLFTGKMAAGVNLFRRIFKGEVSKSVFNADIAKRQPLIDSLQQDSLRLFRYDSHYYNKSINDLTQLAIQQADKPLLVRAKQVLDGLFAEYQHYSDLAQFCDYARANPKKIPSSTLEQARQVKASIELQREAKGRVEYLKTISISYIALLQLYIASCPVEQQEAYKQHYQAFGEQLRQPVFYIPESTMADQLSFSTRSQLLRNAFGGTLTLELPSENIGLSLSATYTNTEKHPNYYRQGEFLDLMISLDNQFNIEDILSLIDSEKTTFNGLDAMLKSNDTEPGVTQQSIISQLRQTLSHVFDVGLELGASLECRFKKSDKKHWNLQFVRIKTQFGRAALMPGLGIEIAPTVKAAVSAKAAETQTVVRQEWLGSNTLSYLLPIYNALNSTEQTERWQLFTKQHEKEFKKIFIAIATIGSSVRDEVDKLLEKIESPELHARLLTAIGEFKQNATANNYQKALTVFNEFLSYQQEVHFKLSEKVWHD
ncbi:hypothetical protein [Spartinivicinus poritis]|uniref:Uncharacterized protein n=1 Tax=Spartinivicinus poritis TaxID=2994640 RepID=A0ABT5UID3_9GAMM|nr:hypothetical protein [Spartinivicinus sp. A2-2]MDE1465193.1 hypothetical protein [Spartinivicinus sp. A2-2]